MSDTAKDDVVAALQQLRAAAEAMQIQRQAELDALRRQVAIARDAAVGANAEVSRLARAIRALDQSGSIPGRPRGSGDSTKTRLRIADILPTRPVWRGTELRDALAEQGHVATANHVSAALSRLRADGLAVRVGKGRWAAPIASIDDDDEGINDDDEARRNAFPGGTA